MRSRYGNENALMPDEYPRVAWPNDIMSDENSFSEMSRDAQVKEVKSLSSNPRD